MPPKKNLLELKGNLDIRKAASIYEELKELQSKKGTITISLKQADDIDFSIIQLLYSFKKTLIGAKRKVSIIDMNAKVSDKIKICDFTELLQEN